MRLKIVWKVIRSNGSANIASALLKIHQKHYHICPNTNESISLKRAFEFRRKSAQEVWYWIPRGRTWIKELGHEDSLHKAENRIITFELRYNSSIDIASLRNRPKRSNLTVWSPSFRLSASVTMKLRRSRYLYTDCMKEKLTEGIFRTAQRYRTETRWTR